MFRFKKPWSVQRRRRPVSKTNHRWCIPANQYPGDKVEVHYRGTLEADGTILSLYSQYHQTNDMSTGSEFDASYNRGTPLSFHVGKGQVIKGWDQGILDMCPGEKRLLTIQPEWGYGSRGMGPIPANSVLVFETELVSVNGKGVEEEEKEKEL